jgi:hypothetical protein
MPAYCRICGKPTKEGEDICQVCKESIQAEATGRQKGITKEASKGVGKSGVRGDRKRTKEEQPPSASHDEEGDKKPHHFTSMAEYLDYLKSKK